MTIIKGNFKEVKRQRKRVGEEKRSPPHYQLHISLAFSDPLIWRRIAVSGAMTLIQLHDVLQVCMGWSGMYNHQFYVGKIFYNTTAAGQKGLYHEADYDLHGLDEAMKWCFTYIYDAGDGWEHDIVVEDSHPAPEKQTYPRVLDGEWAPPPEEVGSVHEYTALLHALENSDSGGRKVILEQHGLRELAPDDFDTGMLNDALQRRLGKI
jgi:hypothetical protein